MIRDLNPIEHVWDFLGRRLAALYLTTSNDSGASIGAARRMGSNASKLIDTLILSMGRRCETCLAVREITSPTKDRMFLAGHPSQGFLPSVALRTCYFFNQAPFLIPLISLLLSVAYITMSLRIGDLTVSCVYLESFCTKLY
ncbi:transposable element Tcb2 transposase [Trichonephila clavipes]|uniref:Transposable element Tcb2 transposase n=1 Tax=Trichonephila clavipes TaxID=2585209 RepID=A0A8X6V8C0_TRICX|nr:transposable element Tcb2 transposase [Trichonephila clavipes]